MQIAFYKSKHKPFNKIVSWWLRGPYSHAELVTDVDPYGSSTCISASWMDGGVRKKEMYLNPQHWDLIEIDADPKFVQEWYEKHVGMRYDILGLLGFVWRRNYQEDTKWFCSEALGAMLKLREPWRLDPMTLWAIVAPPATLLHNK